MFRERQEYRLRQIHIFLVFLVFSSSSALTKDFGVVGTVFEIKEEHLLKLIREKVVEKLQKEPLDLLRKAISFLESPSPVSSIKNTLKPRVYTYLPSVSVTQDIKDSQGYIIAKKGTSLNALDYLPLKANLLFIDGSNLKHVAYAQQHLSSFSTPKIILVNGSPLLLSRILQCPLYFDQYGMLAKRLGIRQVPAFVTQRGKALHIEEENIDENPQIDANKGMF